MQLSINAIVILVMAMAVLGIGLGLIRGVLGSGKDKLLSSLENVDLSQEATAEEPLTDFQSLGSKGLKLAKDNEVIVGYYNNNYCSGEDSNVFINCGSTVSISNKPLPIGVSVGSSGKLAALVAPNASVGSGTKACKVEVYCSSQLTFTGDAATVGIDATTQTIHQPKYSTPVFVLFKT